MPQRHEVRRHSGSLNASALTMVFKRSIYPESWQGNESRHAIGENESERAASR